MPFFSKSQYLATIYSIQYCYIFVKIKGQLFALSIITRTQSGEALCHKSLALKAAKHFVIITHT